jgi:hypothetical protein
MRSSDQGKAFKFNNQGIKGQNGADQIDKRRFHGFLPAFIV